MPFSFLASQTGRTHVCGHRGYSLHYPENTIPAFQAAKDWGATSVEIDVVLSKDGEAIVLHDHRVDRTTDGHGFAADLTLAQIESLDAGSGFHPRFAGTRLPLLTEALDWAKREEMGVVLEIKEYERPDLAIERVASALGSTGTTDRVLVLSFDHTVLKRMVEAHAGIRTEAITHARHADIVAVLSSCGASSVSIELDMFHPDDGHALHEAGLSNRVHLPLPEKLFPFWRGGRDIAQRVVDWIAEGAIDTLSGDDVPFLAMLVEKAGKSE
jgi:glycerophosphoryl diester phosphodiesterase